MALDQHHLKRPVLRGKAFHACVLLVSALALAVIVGLIWTSAAHPHADSMRLLNGRLIGAPEAVRGVMAWILIAACGALAMVGAALLAIDFRAGRLAARRMGKHVRQP